MHKKKIAAVTMAAIISNFSASTVSVLAHEISNQTSKLEVKSNNEEKKATITKFDLQNNSNINAYNETFKMNNSNIESITNNGGKYGSSTIDKSIDGNLSTHWETGKANSSDFTNEVVFTLKELTNLNRIVYAARQDGAKGKGFAQELEIYTSLSNEGDDFKLVANGEYNGSTGDLVEIKFKPTEFKRIKFKFKKANQNWASASEFMFYKEDPVSDKMKGLFTDDTRSIVSEEFNTIDKINALEKEIKNHPLYNDFLEDVENAKAIISKKDVIYTDAKVSKFLSLNDEELANYDKLFKVSRDKIKSITNNGGHYSSDVISNAIDGNANTRWHSGKQNSSNFTNEVVIELNELTTLNRLVYTGQRGSNRGFAEAFDIYASTTSKGDNFEKVTSGSSKLTQDSIEIRFNPTEFKRVKFVFKKGYENWACAAEIGLYSQDIVKEQLEGLFTDSSMTTVSEAFNTIEKINALDERAKSHPMYNKFKEDIDNARVMLESTDVKYSDAKVSKFDITGDTLNKYNEVYKLSRDKIKSISTNGGHYASENIEKALDGDFNTRWHSGKQNSNTFTNEVVIELKELSLLDRIVYTGSKGTNRGFAEAFDIYASKTSKGDNFEKVTSGSAKPTQDSIEIKFNPTEFKRLKFVFKKGYENWATASEFGLYTQDELSEKMKRLFKNGLMNELSDEFNSIEVINNLENEISNHPLKDNFEKDIKLAKNILNNSDSVNDSRIVTGEQRGRYQEGTSKRSINGAAYASFESFGKYVTPGEEIVVYVDADPNGVLPKLCFGQVGKGINDWRRWVNLTPGRNVIKAPTNINPSALYLVNEAYPNEQAYAPRVRIEGGTKFPTYFHGETDPKEFLEELKEYAKNVEYDDKAFENGNPDGKVFNIAEFVSKNVVITTSAKGALLGIEEASKKGYDIADTMDGWEQMYDMFQTFLGFKKDASEEKHSYFPNKFVARVFQGVPLGFADHGYTGYLGSSNAERDGGFFKLIAMPPQMPGNDNWAYTHEFGHIFNTKSIVHGEVTNNLFAQEYRRINNLSGDRANWNGILKRFKGEDVNLGFFENLAILSQLNIAYGYDAYTKASIAVRDNPEIIKSIEGSELRRLAVAYSLGLGVNLLDFFEGWKYTDVTPEMEAAVKHLPKPDKKIEYLHGGAYDYSGNGFSKDVDIKVSSSINKENKTNLLKFEIDNNNKNDLLGYEILKDGKVIGYTKDSSFLVRNVNTDANETYEVVAYAKDLSTAKGIIVNSFKPNISVKQDKLNIKLNEKFNPLDYVKAKSYDGRDITSNIKVEQNVDTNKKGIYNVKYILTDEGITTEKTIQVEVVSSYDYLSDSEWKSVSTQYGTPRRNSNIKGRVNGDIKTFDKGFGIHANGKIVYDLSDKNYDNFEALLGVDMGIQENNNSSITFKIVGDGKTLATTNVLKYSDNMVSINVPVKGVKELVIEVHDGGNGNTLDHSVIANPKLTTNNAKPVINVDNKVYKLGEKVNLMNDVTAIDAEDGDLTSKVEVLKTNYVEGKTGRFNVTYRVTDSDNNSVDKTINIVVYEDYKVSKSKYGQFNNLDNYNKEYKIPVVSVSNNAGNYGSSVIGNTIDGKINTHWETNKPNSDSFNNEIIFDLGKPQEISKIAYAARRDAGGKGFANKFEIYVSNEESGNDFYLAGKGEYRGSNTDVVEFNIEKTTARRVKFKFVEANANWASMGEIGFYKEDAISNKINNELFTDSNKSAVSEKYNTLDKLNAFKEEVKNYPAYELFKGDFDKAEELIRATFPTLNIPKSESTKLGQAIDLTTGYSATDSKDGDLTSKIEVTGKVNFNRPGKYTLTYKVTDSDGNEVVKTRTIAVVNMEDFKYLTDYNWKSTQNSYKAPNKDKSMSGKALRLTNENGQEVTYERGIGAHSTSTIIYDLSDKDYAYFTSYVGVDRQMFGTVGSVSFEVYVDGEKKFDSGLMKSRDPQKYVEVDINGAKELKLVVTDGGNGNGSDHATWGDAKLHFANESESEAKQELRELVEYADTITKDMIGGKNHIDARWSNFEMGKQIAKECLEDNSKSDEEVKNSINMLNYFISELEIK